MQLACANVPRDAALIELALQTGMHVGAVAALRLADLTLSPRTGREYTGAAHVQGKGGGQRTVSLNFKACRSLRSYLAVRSDAPTDRVFVSEFRTPPGRARSPWGRRRGGTTPTTGC